MGKTKKLYELTPEHREQLGHWARKWIANAMKTSRDGYTPTERAGIAESMRGLYSAAGLEPPKNEVFAPSPICAGFASGIAAGVWWLRDNPSKHLAMFGRTLAENEILAGRDAACAVADARAAPRRIALNAATRAATDAATDAATHAATHAATRDATHAATDAATRDATHAATHAATRAATHAATRAATRDATYAATDDATYAATDAATRDATYAATDAATRDANPALVSFLLACATRWWSFYQGGNQWSGWTAYLSFFRHVAKLDIDYSKFAHFEALAECGPRYVHAKFWIVAELPQVLKVDEENRPHSAVGPFCRWRDGRELYYWRGTQVPREWIMEPSKVDPGLALTWQNMEQRRCLIEILGWGKVLGGVDRKVVDKHADPEMGTLFEVSMKDDNGRPGRFLEVQCGTWSEQRQHRRFVLRVPPDTESVQAAQDWLWQVDNYAPERRT